MVAYEGEPEAGAARDAPVVGGAPSKEPFKDLFAFLERDARSVVVDVDGERITLKGEAHRDRAVGVAVRVVDQVGHHALETAPVDLDQRVAGVGVDLHGRFGDAVASRRRAN